MSMSMSHPNLAVRGIWHGFNVSVFLDWEKDGVCQNASEEKTKKGCFYYVLDLEYNACPGSLAT
jgi:hypothetical protein